MRRKASEEGCYVLPTSLPSICSICSSDLPFVSGSRCLMNRKPASTDGGVYPERSRGAELRIQKREGIGQHETGAPQRGDGDRHRRSPHSVWKNFRNDDPGHGASDIA